MARFQDRVALITGGAEGIGKAVALRLGREGAAIALVDVQAEKLMTTVKELEASGIQAKGYVTDISQEAQVITSIHNIVTDFERIDVLVNAAGIVGPTSTPITRYDSADFDRICEVNLKGSFLMTKYTLGAMEPHGYGRILLISSIAGKEGNPGMVGYSATKAAITGLVKGVAKEFAGKGITVNGLAPAVIRTAMNANTSAEQLAYMTARIPMGRLGTVEEVAALCAFIVSEENSFTTGFIYDISGGRATY
jgi:NAD(P)-dependent dehydrogenase (short-subunit alcohol dehydrogenase family)